MLAECLSYLADDFHNYLMRELLFGIDEEYPCFYWREGLPGSLRGTAATITMDSVAHLGSKVVGEVTSLGLNEYRQRSSQL